MMNGVPCMTPLTITCRKIASSGGLAWIRARGELSAAISVFVGIIERIISTHNCEAVATSWNQ